MNSFTDLINRRTAQYGDKFDVSDLDKRFIAYYQNGQRISVMVAMLPIVYSQGCLAGTHGAIVHGITG